MTRIGRVSLVVAISTSIELIFILTSHGGRNGFGKRSPTRRKAVLFHPPTRYPQRCLSASSGAKLASHNQAGNGMLLVTGGAGFIGSNVVAALNEAGRADVAVCDMLGHEGKWRNLAKRQLADIVPPAELADWLKGRRLDAVIHLGAISETTATDGDLVIETNFRLSMRLLAWCTANVTPFIYASSASTYGDGAQGFHDDQSVAALKTLRPMNLYG